MENNQIWDRYKLKIIPTIKVYKDNQLHIIVNELSINLGKLMTAFNDELKKEIDNKAAKMMALGDLLYSIATIEYVFKLPSTIHAYLLNIKFEVDPEEFNYPLIIQELHVCAGDLIFAMYTGNISEVQYEANSLFAILVDYCVVFDINMINCLNCSLIKEQGEQQNPKSQYSKQYKVVKDSIKKANKEELLFDINLSSKKEYKHIILTLKNEKIIFDTGDVVVDHFKAMNHIINNIPENIFRMNYSAKFREYLSSNKIFKSGFIVGENIINAAEFLKNKSATAQGGIVSTDKNYKPCLYIQNMTTLNDLLDYINAKTKI